MENLRYIAFDVHKKTIWCAVFSPESYLEPILEKEILNSNTSIKKFLKSLGKNLSIKSCYEAGCLGYDLHRFLVSCGIDNMIVAPACIPRSRKNSIQKSDRTDARHLGRMLCTGQVTPINIPTIDDEAVRDYLRLREDTKIERAHARQRILSFLLRHSIKYDQGKKTWTKNHLIWIHSIKIESQILQKTLDLYLTRVNELTQRLESIDETIEQIALSKPYVERVQRLCGLKGIGILTALSFTVEIGDFKRFASAPSFMSYLGLVPSEHSSGAKRHMGGITKHGNTHLRRLLIECSWCYRFKSRGSKVIWKRRDGLDPSLLAYYNKADKHLEEKFFKMAITQRKSGQLTVTSVARELAGFIWGVANMNIM